MSQMAVLLLRISEGVFMRYCRIIVAAAVVCILCAVFVAWKPDPHVREFVVRHPVDQSRYKFRRISSGGYVLGALSSQYTAKLKVYENVAQKLTELDCAAFSNWVALAVEQERMDVEEPLTELDSMRESIQRGGALFEYEHSARGHRQGGLCVLLDGDIIYSRVVWSGE